MGAVERNSLSNLWPTTAIVVAELAYAAGLKNRRALLEVGVLWVQVPLQVKR